MTRIGTLHRTVAGINVREVPLPHKQDRHLCTGCVANEGGASYCYELPECGDRTIFIMDTDEAVAEYVLRRMHGGQLP